jgi:hypothetical protein
VPDRNVRGGALATFDALARSSVPRDVSGYSWCSTRAEALAAFRQDRARLAVYRRRHLRAACPATGSVTPTRTGARPRGRRPRVTRRRTATARDPGPPDPPGPEYDEARAAVPGSAVGGGPVSVTKDGEPS